MGMDYECRGMSKNINVIENITQGKRTGDTILRKMD